MRITVNGDDKIAGCIFAGVIADLGKGLFVILQRQKAAAVEDDSYMFRHAGLLSTRAQAGVIRVRERLSFASHSNHGPGSDLGT